MAKWAEAVEPFLGAKGLLSGREAGPSYRVDWSGDFIGVPAFVAKPDNAQAVAKVVEASHDYGVRLVPQGGNTGLVGGATATEGEVIVSLERMNRIREIDPVNFSMIAEAGCIVEHVKAAADASDLLFPLAIASQGSTHLGGVIATNAGGMNVLRYGMMRELVLGLEAVLPDGTIWHGLKRLRKDNRGYDLKQLLIGSEGTLAIITAASLKLFPRPAFVETAFVALQNIEALLGFFGEARRRLCDLLSAFELLTAEGLADALDVFPEERSPVDSPAPFFVILEVSASGDLELKSLLEGCLAEAFERGSIVDAAVAQNQQQTDGFWRLREGAIEAQRRLGRHLRTDVSVPISAIGDFLTKATSAVVKEAPGVRPRAHGHIGDGNIHFNVIPPQDLDEDSKIAVLNRCEQRILEIADALDGSISAEHGIGIAMKSAHRSRMTAKEHELATAIKRSFDPDLRLSRGRIFDV